MYIHHQLLFGFLIIALNGFKSYDFHCSRDSNSFKCRLGSNTPYRFIVNYNDSMINFPGCEARKIWLVIRHGTRYPSVEKILSIAERLPKIQKAVLNNCKVRQCHLTEEQRRRFADWKETFMKKHDHLLATEGQDELIALAERFQSRFPALMPEIYNNHTYKFKFTANQRTEDSAKHFAIGLFGKHQSNRVWYPEANKKDPILRFYKACPRWQKDVNKNPDSYAEVEQFKKSPIVIRMLEDVSNRLGYKVDYETVGVIRTACAFETALHKNNKSPWCDLLTPYEFEIMEFAHDLAYYWIDGYGYELTYKHACSALRDMFDFFNIDDEIKTTAYFTHSGTLLKMLSLLGIAKDEKPLLHDSFSSSKDRLWRTSLIDAFATNIAFVSYNCKSDGPSILVMHQEHIVNLPGCTKDIPCPLSIMQEQYPDKEEECKFTEMCSIEE